MQNEKKDLNDQISSYSKSSTPNQSFSDFI